jgi:hypothetical protein
VSTTMIDAHVLNSDATDTFTRRRFAVIHGRRK